MGVPAGDERRRLNRIVNPLSETTPYLRTSLLPGLFAAVARNRSRGTDDLALFEAGSVFFARDPLRPAPRPPVTGRPAPERAGRDGRRPGSAAAAPGRGALRSAAQRLVGRDRAGRPGPTPSRSSRRPLRPSAWRWSGARRPGRPGIPVAVPSSSSTDRSLGYAGELHPEVCRAFDLPARTVAAEIDLDALIAAAPARGDIPLVSGFPVAKEDVALIVAADVPAADGRAGAPGRCRPAAGVADPVRRLHRSAGAAWPRLAGVRAPLPGSRPDPHRRRDGGGAGCRRRGRRGADRRRPAHAVAVVVRTARSSRRWRWRKSVRRGR